MAIRISDIFPYRDYVIDAFIGTCPLINSHVNNLAGDLLPNLPRATDRIRFQRLNMMTREGGAQPKEYLAKYQADRVRDSRFRMVRRDTWLLRMSHHKFDPFTQKDFYSISAVLC